MTVAVFNLHVWLIGYFFFTAIFLFSFFFNSFIFSEYKGSDIIDTSTKVCIFLQPCKVSSKIGVSTTNFETNSLICTGSSYDIVNILLISS